MMCNTLSMGVCRNWDRGASSRGISIDMVFPQLLFVDLAHAIARQEVYKLNLARRFVVRQLFTTIRFQSFSIHLATLHHKGFDFFAHALRGDADDGRFDDRRVA